MKHTIVFLFFMSFSGASAQVPDWAWARAAGSSANDEVTSMAADPSGNVYATGYFSGPSIVFGTTTLTNGGSGSKQFFLVKYDRTGAVVWAKAAGGSDDDQGNSVALDGSGNVYVCGNFESTSITFGGGAVANNSNPGLSDMFLVKFNAAGIHQWSFGYGGSLQEEGNAIDVDIAGNVAMTGNFYSLSVLFGSSGVINSGVSDAFLTKFSSAGVAQWSKRIGGGQTDNGNDVGFDNSGNIYVTGDYNSTTIPTFSPALTNSGGFDVFVAKYNSSGNSTLAFRFGGSGDESSTALHAQSSGNFFIAGYFESTSLTFASTTLNNSGTRSMYLVKYNTGGAAQWAQKAAGGQNSNPAELAEGTSGIFMTGSFDLSSLVFGSTTLSNGGSLDGFIVQYDISSGSVIWAKTTGSSSLEQAQALAIGAGLVHIGGLFTNTLVLRDNHLNAVSSTDAFVTKLCLPPANPLTANGSTSCPGSPVTLNATSPAGTSPVWFTAATGGPPVHTGNSFAGTPGTTYYVAARDTNQGCAMYSATRLSATGASHPAVNAAITVSGHTLTANGNGTVTAWLDCEHQTVIPGASGNNFVLSASGHYAVVLTSAQGCKDTSSCNHYSYTPGSTTVVVTTGVNQAVKEALRLSAYPNPSSGVFQVQSNVNAACVVVNALGQTILHLELNERNGRAAVVGPLPAGFYFLVPAGARHAIKRVVVSP